MAVVGKIMSSLFEKESDIYYFGYGPIVNPVVRNRRGVNLFDEQAAFLPDYRLRFNFGGLANVMQQRGYDVHGILMKVGSYEDWKTLCSFDAGYYDIEKVEVFPYTTPDEPIQAYTMVMKDCDKSMLESKIEKLPQERYLNLIAQGMRVCKLNDDYIEDQIMAVPFLASRKRENWLTFPEPSSGSSSSSSSHRGSSSGAEALPQITYDKYLKMCKKSNPNEIYIVLNNKVIRLKARDPTNPGARWFEEHAHGKEDITLALHKLVVDPDIPMVDSPDQLTPLHYAWAENHACEFFGQCGVRATKEYDLIDKVDGRSGWFSKKRLGLLCCCRSNDASTGGGGEPCIPDNSRISQESISTVFDEYTVQTSRSIGSSFRR